MARAGAGPRPLVADRLARSSVSDDGDRRRRDDVDAGVQPHRPASRSGKRRCRRRGVEHKYPKNSHASATATTDGQRVYASFGTHGLAAFDFSGKLVWHTKLGDLSNYHGSAGSPVLYKDRVFLYQDHDGTATLGSFVAAFDAATGKVIWKRDRPETVGWGTPVIINTGTRDELIVNSQRRVSAYDPETGQDLWTVRGMTFEVIPTPVVGHGLVFCSSGRAGTDARDQARRVRRRHHHAHRLVVAEGIAVRAVGVDPRAVSSTS